MLLRSLRYYQKWYFLLGNVRIFVFCHFFTKSETTVNLFRWQPFAIRKGFWWQKVANGKGWRRKRLLWQPFAIRNLFWWQRLPSETFTIRKGLRRQRLPSVTFSNGKGCHQKRLPMAIGNLCCRKQFLMVKVADGNLFLQKPWPTATFCCWKSLPTAKVANGQGCHWKRYPTAKGCRLPLGAFSEGNLNALESTICFFS